LTDSLKECMIYKAQHGNSLAREQLVASHMEFIRRTGSRICGRQLSSHDDEMSICLIAFNQALDTFNHEANVPLKSYASVVIRNKLIDYLRNENRHRHRHIPLSSANDNQEDDTYSPIEYQEAVKIHQLKSEEELRKYEITYLGDVLKRFEISWSDLVSDCPKHLRKRKICLKAAKVLADQDDLWEFFWRNKMLPVKRLAQIVDVSRKTMERSRKYIAAVAVLLKYKKELPLLYDYVRDEVERG